MDGLIRDMREAADVILALPPYSRAIVSPAVQLAVMAQRAADELEKAREIVVLWDMYGGSEGITDAFERAEKARWIPVEERLPEEAGEHLVAYNTCYWDNVSTDVRVGMDTFRGKSAWAKKKYQRVTHWMPLPAPPKEESNGNQC